MILKLNQHYLTLFLIPDVHYTRLGPVRIRTTLAFALIMLVQELQTSINRSNKIIMLMTVYIFTVYRRMSILTEY